VWALRGVDLEIDVGEAVGIIGDNGAGKTTLLKILSRITEPTEGLARVRGRVGALLDVGTGFHPELTGRENVFLSGTILGLRRHEVKKLFDEIIAFAGVERFVDTPVKRYSAGMRLRLAFAVAAFIRPSILVVDEILAVGDASFRERCLGRMAEISEEQRTVLFVSHDLGAVSQLCERAIWLKEGAVYLDGPANQVIADYLSTGAASSLSADFPDEGTEPVALTRVAIEVRDELSSAELRRDQPFTVCLEIRLHDDLPVLDAGVGLTNLRGVRVLDDAHSDYQPHRELVDRPGKYEVRVEIPPILSPDQYTLSVWLGTDREDLLIKDVLNLRVAPLPEDSREAAERTRAVQPRLSWSAVRLAEA
jgi:ABC-type polysaccharide/polyol phosphate transport system ATPase subunit